MKKLLFVVALAAAMPWAYAEESAPAAPADAPKAADGARPVRQRPVFSRAKFDEQRKQLRAERMAKVLDAIKAAGVTDEAKAKELAETIDKLYLRPMRPLRQPRPPRPVKQDDKPVEQK